MLRGSMRGAFQSARQARRAAARRGAGAGAGGRRGGAELEGAFCGQQRRAFGKGYAETVPRALAVAGVGMLDVGAVHGPLVAVLDGLVLDDDDGR